MKKCPYCGKEYPDDATICAIDLTPLDGTEAETIANQDRSPSAGFGIRLLARIVDTFLGLFLGLMAGFVGGMVIVVLSVAGAIEPGWRERLHEFSFAPFAFGLVGNFMYHFLCEGIHGATIGKLCCGLCVVTQDLKPSTLKGAFIRTLAFYVDGLVCGLVGYNSMCNSLLNQRYGDVWGKTVVAKTKELPPESRHSSDRLLFGLLAGIGCWFVLLTAGLLWRVM